MEAVETEAEFEVKPFICKLCALAVVDKVAYEFHLLEKHSVSINVKKLSTRPVVNHDNLGMSLALEMETLVTNNADPLTQWFMCDKCQRATSNLETATTHLCFSSPSSTTLRPEEVNDHVRDNDCVGFLKIDLHEPEGDNEFIPIPGPSLIKIECPEFQFQPPPNVSTCLNPVPVPVLSPSPTQKQMTATAKRRAANAERQRRYRAKQSEKLELLEKRQPERRGKIPQSNSIPPSLEQTTPPPENDNVQQVILDNDAQVDPAPVVQVSGEPVTTSSGPKLKPKRRNYNGGWADTYLEILNGERPFGCKVCRMTYATKKSLRRHTDEHKRGHPLICPLCGKSFSLTECYKVHVASHDPTTKRVCELCGASVRDLTLHMKIHDVVKEFKCDECEYRTGRRTALRMHKRIHSDKREFLCEECGYAAKRKAVLRIHKLKHTGEREFKCDLCPFAAIVKAALELHVMRVHTGEKPFSCDICKTRFHTNEAKRSHKRRHQKRGETVDNWVGVEATPTEGSKPTLVRPVEKTFKCNLCNMASVTADGLRSHKRRNHKCEEKGIRKKAASSSSFLPHY